MVEKTYELINDEKKYNEYKSKIEQRIEEFTLEKNKEKLKELIEKVAKTNRN